MADPIGISLGAISLSIQLLDGAVKGFMFFLAVGEMETACLHYRTSLEMQQRRLVEFATDAKFIDYLDGEDVPPVLKRENLVLVSVFSQIDTKLAELAVFTDRYQQFQHDDEAESKSIGVKDLDAAQQYPSLVSWEKAAERRARRQAAKNKHLKGTNHLVKWFKVGRSIVSDPKRIRWTAIDQKAFAAILDDLKSYNDFLDGLLKGEQARKVEERLRKISMEMVVVRNGVDDLKVLLNTLVQGSHGSDTKSASAFEHHPLKILAETKLASIINEELHSGNPPTYEEVIKDGRLSYSLLENIIEIPQANEGGLSQSRQRTTADLRRSIGSAESFPVFIEWKPYSAVFEKSTNRRTMGTATIDRADGLVTLLQKSELHGFRTAECRGWFDLRDAGPERPPLIGFVYETPKKAPGMPENLLKQLTTTSAPPLGERMRLAYAISDAIMYLNSVHWFHKSFRSDAVILPANKNSVDITKPLLAGFEYSRPGNVTGRTTHPSQLPEDELYVHPDYQGLESGARFARSYDIYALGIVLIEIAYWKPIKLLLQSYFATPGSEPISKDAKKVRSILVEGGEKAPYLENLKSMMGEKYHAAVAGCIRGFVNEDEDERLPEVSIKLHEAFAQFVVGPLSQLMDI